MNDYSLSQIKSMQDEATKRVREMNERSKRFVENSSQNNQQPSVTQKPLLSQNAEESKSKPPEKKPAASGLIQKSGIKNLLGAIDLKKIIGENSEQAILLLLILILLNDNNSDDYLIYALVYIML